MSALKDFTAIPWTVACPVHVLLLRMAMQILVTGSVLVTFNVSVGKVTWGNPVTDVTMAIMEIQAQLVAPVSLATATSTVASAMSATR